MASVTEHETALDQHVVYFLRKHPEFYDNHTISRIQPGRYVLDGREIEVEWQYGQNGEEGHLVAVDGPLRQPFADYVHGHEANAHFDNQRLPLSNLQQIPKERQLSFGDMHKVVSRLDAMKIAKEQALVREMAAEYAKDGQRVPQSALIERYKKTIDTKLGKRRPTAPPPAAPPVAAAPEPAPAPPAHAQSDGPVFCSNHDSTEKRKKVAPRKVACKGCGEVVTTNYAEFEFCHTCSRKENKCLCCGVSVGGGQTQTQNTPPPQGSPVYCTNHNQSEKRKKCKPRDVQCTSCGVTVNTNYVDFTLCINCSQAQNRCMCCGVSTSTPTACAPCGQMPSMVPPAMNNQPASIGFPGFPQLPGMQMMNPLASGILSPSPLVGFNPLASQNAFAGGNPMASANPMMFAGGNPMASANPLMSQKVF